MTDAPKPSPVQKIAVTIDGQEYELLMAYGLLNRLLKLVSGEVDALQASLSSALRDNFFVEVLTKRGKSGAFEKFSKDNLDDIDMSSEDAQRLLDWITDHILDFFLGVAERAAATEQKYASRTSALMQSSGSTQT